MDLGRIDYADGQWLITDLKPHVSMRFKDVFKGIRFGERPPYRLQDREDRAVDLDWFTSRYPLALTDRAAAHMATRLAAYGAGRQRLEELQAPDYRATLLTGFRPGEKARAHQLRAAEMLRQTGRLLLLDEVGLGKTVSALAAISDGWGLPAAIVVQPHLSGQWIADYIRRFTDLTAVEVKDRSPRTLPPADVYVFRYSNVGAWSDYAKTLGCRTVSSTGARATAPT